MLRDVELKQCFHTKNPESSEECQIPQWGLPKDFKSENFPPPPPKKTKQKKQNTKTTQPQNPRVGRMSLKNPPYQKNHYEHFLTLVIAGQAPEALEAGYFTLILQAN